MLSTLKTILILILLSGWALAAASLYVVRTPGDWPGIGIVPKNRLGFKDTYVDVRTWTADDLKTHPALLRRLIATEKTHWIEHIVKKDEAGKLLDD